MSTTFCKFAFFLSLSCVGAFFLNNKYALGGDKPSVRVKKLIDNSAEGMLALESGLLIKNPLIADDIPEAISYIKKHNDEMSRYYNSDWTCKKPYNPQKTTSE